MFELTYSKSTKSSHLEKKVIDYKNQIEVRRIGSVGYHRKLAMQDAIYGISWKGKKIPFICKSACQVGLFKTPFIEGNDIIYDIDIPIVCILISDLGYDLKKMSRGGPYSPYYDSLFFEDQKHHSYIFKNQDEHQQVLEAIKAGLPTLLFDHHDKFSEHDETYKYQPVICCEMIADCQPWDSSVHGIPLQRRQTEYPLIFLSDIVLAKYLKDKLKPVEITEQQQTLENDKKLLSQISPKVQASLKRSEERQQLIFNDVSKLLTEFNKTCTTLSDLLEFLAEDRLPEPIKGYHKVSDIRNNEVALDLFLRALLKSKHSVVREIRDLIGETEQKIHPIAEELAAIFFKDRISSSDAMAEFDLHANKKNVLTIEKIMRILLHAEVNVSNATSPPYCLNILETPGFIKCLTLCFETYHKDQYDCFDSFRQIIKREILNRIKLRLAREKAIVQERSFRI